MIDQTTAYQQFCDAAGDAFEAALAYQRAHIAGDPLADELYRIGQEKMRVAHEAQQRYDNIKARENRSEP